MTNILEGTFFVPWHTINVVSETQFKKINVQEHLLTLIPLYSYKQWNNEKRRARTSVFYFHRLTTTSTSARMIYVDLWGCGVHYTTTTGTMRILSCLATIQVYCMCETRRSAIKRLSVLPDYKGEKHCDTREGINHRVNNSQQ